MVITGLAYCRGRGLITKRVKRVAAAYPGKFSSLNIVAFLLIAFCQDLGELQSECERRAFVNELRTPSL